ncbi:hypothetical protein [Dactylosporangium sp. CA-139066]|uniref:hypothetical protein n=1 Tax=Dactylosporangium sp. CA-139066 TaxID=3239930 RepID=UPI003D8B40A0
MTGFLSELGKKAAERWLALIVVPGLLLVAVVWASWTLRRHNVWFDPAPLRADVRRWSGERAEALVLGAAGALLAAAGAAQLARGLSGAVERLWFAAGLGGLGRRLTRRRAERWQERDRAYERALLAEPGGADLDALLAARDRICPVRPARPTWMADRARAAGERVYLAYDLDLTSLWPRLWLIVPEAARNELAAARTAVTANARLFAWGVLYLVPALWWWPAALVAVVTGAVAWRRARAATDVLADLAESAVDLYGPALAAQLGVAAPDGLTPAVGLAVTERLRKDG